METVLRTLKVRLVADITDYSGPMAAAQAQAAALKAQLSTMFTGLGGMSAAGVTQLIAPIDKLSGRLNGISNQMDTAFRRITQGAATAGREVAALAQTQAKMMQDAVTAANQLRALPAPAAGASAAPGAPIGPMVTPSAPRITQSAQSAMQAAAAAGASRTREMFPIGDSYEAQNPIWRMRQKGLEDAAYRDGPGSKAWSDYQNARMAGGLKPAVWHDATKYLEDKSAAGGIAQQMQRMQDQGATMAARSAGLPAVVGSSALATGPDLRAFAEAQAADAAADLERTIARKAKLAADRAFRKAKRELAEIESKAAAARPKGLQDPYTSDGHGLKAGPSGTDKHLFRMYKDQIPAAQTALDAAATAKAAADTRFGAASDTAAKARTDLEGFRKQAADVDADRERSLQVAKRQNDLAAEQQAKRESAHARHLANLQEEERLKARAEHHDREREARETQARHAAADAERAALAASEERRRAGGGGGGHLPPGASVAAAAAGGAGLPATIAQMADDAERVPGAFAKTRELWREMVAQSGGVRGAIGNLFTGAGQGLARTGNRMVQTGNRFSTRFALPVGIAGGLMLNKASQFESTMAAVGVYAKDAGATAGQIEKLSDRARELGRTTSFSATEVAQAMKEMLAAGLSVETVFAKIVPALERGKREQISIADFIDTEGLKGELRDVRDLTEELNAAELGTFKGQFQQLGGALGELSIAIGKAGLLEFASNVAKGMAGLVDGLAKADPALLSAAAAGAGLLAVIGPSIVAAGSLLWGVGQLATGIGALIPILTGPAGLAAAAALLGGALAVGLMGAFTILTQGSGELADVLGRLNKLQGESQSLSEEYKTASEERAIQIRRERNAVFELMEVELARAEKLAKLQAENPMKYATGPVMFRSMTALDQAKTATERVAQERAELDALAKSWDDAHKARAEYLKQPVEADPAFVRPPLSPADQAIYERMRAPWDTTGEEVATSAETMAERLNFWLSKGIEPGVAASLAAAEAVRKAWKQTYDDVAAPTQFKTDTSAAFGEPSAKDLWDGAVNSLGDMEHGLGAARTNKNPALEKLEDLHGDAVELLEGISDPMKLTLAQAEGLASEMFFLTTTFDAAASSATTFSEVLAERLSFWLGKGLEPSIAAAKAHAEAVSNAWAKTYDDVVGHSYVPDMVDEIGEQMARLDEVAVAPAEKATSTISGLFADMGASVGAAMDEIGDAIGGGLRGALNGLLTGRGVNSADLIRSILGDLQGQTARSTTNSIFGGLGDMFKGWSGATKGKDGWTENKSGGWVETALSWVGNLFGGGRANGGAVMPGRIYEVGEFGREKFIPRQPGYIATDNQWDALTRGGGGGGGGGHYVDARVTINGNVDGVTMPALQAALDANNRMWAARLPSAVNATLLDNRRQQRRI